MRSIASGQAGQRQPLSAAWVARPSRLLVVVLVLLALAPPAYLLQTGGALTAGYTIQTLEKERASWQVRNQQLEVEIARARSLAWVEHEAVHRLGMRRPAEQLVVRMEIPPPAVIQPRVPRAPEAAATATPAPAAQDGSFLDDLGSAVSSLLPGN